ncbi:MAG: Hsp70 family protein [Synergistaceae bacterium]|jgi:molecular chaperone DnaK (HSP70)|nr:Hsp70 family protein [Synergistaceae bacterium]
MAEQLEGKVFGIDLGTTYSCIAEIDNYGKAVIVPDPDDSNIATLPSVVLFEENGSVVVGVEAKKAFESGDRLVSFAKRDIGRALRDEDGNVVKDSEKNDKLFTYLVGGKEYTPHQISAYVLSQLKHNAERMLNLDDGGVKDVVITCPAYFGDNEIRATKLAGEIAGLNVLQVIAEPTAAAIFYYTEQGSLTADEKTVLVYDLGGGTFDVTYVAFSKGKIKVVCTEGDHMLGGKDWDKELVGIVKEKYAAQFGDEEYSTAEENELWYEVEEGKRNLTKREQTKIRCKGKPVDVTKGEFEERTAHLLQLTSMLIGKVLSEAEKQKYGTPDEVVLVGGSSRMPQVEAMLLERFGEKPKLLDPDLAVAKGAAVYATFKQIQNTIGGSTKGIPEGQGAIFGPETDAASVKIAHITSKSYGTCANDIGDGGDGEYKVFNVVYKNSEVPGKWTDNGFSLMQDGQTSIAFEIMQNNSTDYKLSTANADQIGNGTLYDLPPGLDKSTVVEVIFEISEDGSLTMHGKCAGKSVKIDAKNRIEMSEKEIKAAQAEVERRLKRG